MVFGQDGLGEKDVPITIVPVRFHGAPPGTDEVAARVFLVKVAATAWAAVTSEMV